MLEQVKKLNLEELKALKKEVEQLIALKTVNVPAKKAIFEIKRTDIRHKNWAKVVKRVDVNKQDGYAFEGRFLSVGVNEANVGDIIMHYYGVGSVKNYYIYVDIYRLTENGLQKIEDASGTVDNREWRTWALYFRDDVAKLVNGGQE